MNIFEFLQGLGVYEFLHPLTQIEARNAWLRVKQDELDEQATEVFRVLDIITPAMNPVDGSDEEPRPSRFAENVAGAMAFDDWDTVDAAVFNNVSAEDGADRFDWWYHRMWATQLDRPRSLLAAANAMALVPLAMPNQRGELYGLTANALRLVSGRGPAAAASVLEGFLRLDEHAFERDPDDPGRLACQLDARFDELKIDGQTRANVVISLANALRLVSGRGPAAAASVLEGFLRLDDHAFERDSDDPGRLARQLEARFDELKIDGHARANVVMSLADALRLVGGRGPAAAASVLEGFLRLDDHAFERDPDRLARQIDARFDELDIESGHTRANVVISLANALRLVSGRGPAAAASVLEGFLRLDDDAFERDPDDPGRLARQIDARFNELDIESGHARANVVISLAAALRLVGGRGPAAAAWVLEGFLRLDDDAFERDSDDPGRLARRLEARFDELDIDGGVTQTNTLGSLADALHGVDRSEDAVALLLAGLDLDAETLKAETLQAALAAKQIAHMQNGINYLMLLGNAAGVGSDIALEAAKACHLLVLGVLDPHSGNSIQAKLDFLAAITPVAPFYRRVGLAHMAKSPERKRELARSMSWWLRNVQNRGLVLRLIDGTAKSMNRPKIVSETELTTSKWPFMHIADENNQAWNEDVNRAWRVRLQTDFDNNIAKSVYAGDWLAGTQQLCLEARKPGGQVTATDAST